MTYQATVRYADHTMRMLSVDPDQTVLQAAHEHGVPIVSECESGVCGTCIGRCVTGSYVLGHCIGISEHERREGRILTCQTRVTSDCEIELDYPLTGNAARIVTGEAVVTEVAHISDEIVHLALDASALPEPIGYKPGQFAQLEVPGTKAWRSYSFAHAPRAGSDVEFLVRLLPGGVMSEYLRSRARPGDRVGFRGPKGGFHLRDGSRPVVLVAGGTGLSAILSLAEALLARGHTAPVCLQYAVTQEKDLALTTRLELLAREHPNFSWHATVAQPGADWTGQVGLATDALDQTDMHGGNLDVYLCGPAAMIDACLTWLKAHGCSNANVYYEEFVASGAPPSRACRVASPDIDVAEIRRRGQGRAVVIGGSIAGMSAAQVLTETFDGVQVLEKGGMHRRMEGRPDSAQGWHLHHLLIGGQRQLESVFPGVIDDMVRSGAFKVDMGEQYRIMLAGSWKSRTRSGVEIVCAGRPLLEWCVRRRLDKEPKIDYRYDTEVKNLLFDNVDRRVIGLVAEHRGTLEVVPAEFVVDASGKNSQLPAVLERHGYAAPTLDEDHINCFYSTMLHRVPPERVWTDKVMVISYAHRPHQKYYAAQYYIDQSRTVLSTSLVGYDCYDPPRNAEEFREFARRMPAPDIGDELDGLEPCSPVRNFRYPTMQRYNYEALPNLPRNLVALGDAYSSADPVSGAGMTKALLELNELRDLLRSRPSRGDLVAAYYQRVGRISDSIWSVIREQNLRYPWIKDVESKRPVLFRARTWYVDRVFEALHQDPELYRLYLMVTHFVEPPSALMRPHVVARVLGKWLKTRATFKPTLLEKNFGAADQSSAP